MEELMLHRDHALDQVDHVGPLELERARAVLDAREVEHGVHEPGEAAHLLGHRLEVLVV